MKRLALAALLLAAGCSSNSLAPPSRTFDAGAGGAIDVQLIGQSTPVMMFARGGDLPQQIAFQFLVSNDSSDTVTVKKIMVYQKGAAPVQLETALAGFDTGIEPGHDAQFRVSATARQLRPARSGDDTSIGLRADVTLTNGDTYVYSFDLPVSLAAQ